ncbi:hypothetical protein [Leptospira santarosai]|uniref:Uncharacterized protein n=1 Tax=Leptospira santarosai str. CBC1416 TaxID=1193059 RepID=M6VUW1_9LEPT|nr:hypothetical protein B2G51_15050 [Leptospira santarosai]EMO58906.1 hypothetical protein LEP1GSC161_1971 [Leptospira santarosai str. CBC1416]
MGVPTNYVLGTSIKSKYSDLKIKFLHEVIVFRRSIPNEKTDFIEVFFILFAESLREESRVLG